MKRLSKVLPLALALALSLASMSFSYGSEEMTTEEKAKVLFDLQLFDGVSKKEFIPQLDGLANREQAAKMIVVALDLEVCDDLVTDYIGVSSWAQPYVATAYNMDVTEGFGVNEDGAKIFGGSEIITARQFQTWFDRILTDSTTTWEDNITLDNELCINRGQLIEITYESLLRSPVGASKSLIEGIVANDTQRRQIAKDAGLVKVKSTFSINSVIMDNDIPLAAFQEEVFGIDSIEVKSLNQILVTFNKPLNSYTAEQNNFYTICDCNGDKVPYIIEDLELTEPDQVTITFEESLNGDYSLELEGVRDIDGHELEQVGYFFIDGYERAEISEVKAYGRDFIQIIFTEEVDQDSCENEDNYALYDDEGLEIVDFIDTMTWDGDKVINIGLDLDLVDGKYIIRVKGIEDSHGNIVRDEGVFRIWW